MVEVEEAQEGVMWLVVVAAATLAASRFAAYLTNVRAVHVDVETAVAWWSTWTIGVGLVVVGLLGQRTSRPQETTNSWLSLLVGILLLVLMPATPSAGAAVGLLVPARPTG